ncbi:nucleoside-diphosphate sugar epimerase/dehydratase [Candidatus Thioglobus autotrophicus]|uniref:polysaccharide biosynthesis protein n=1 Tax=Candidatus Thioglobus autotrophicus TaxID=1705394 RepID=UPI00299DAB70|nr:nucleoside-diphosphate sugar epimerase/dehydratase [Candidatus Thioglobus autotrophicus]WPE15924.1 nucleoside-diphosphate sugar epimerase/dehydratase [Candidatus Thioglobus autotrophicus]
MLNLVINLSRINKQLIMLLVDSMLLVSILLASFSIRLGYWYFPQDDLIWVVLGAPVVASIIFVRFGLYRAVIRYIGFKALWTVVQAVSLYALVWGVIGFMVAVDGIPRSVILINWMLSLLAIGGLRVVARWLLTREGGLKSCTQSSGACKKVLVYGAGDAGIQLVSALSHSSEYNPVGFIDDSNELQGNQIRGLNICSVNSIERVINKLKVDEVLIAMPSASRTKRLDIINTLEPYPVLVRMLPGVAELAEGKVSIGDLREVSIKDLLGRESVEANKDLLGKNITNKVVVVTGAGGSIGSELCRQIVFLKPKALILYEMSELALYSIDKELSNIGMHSLDIYPILGSVNNKTRLSNVFKRFGVDTIYHAAAYKHVPMVEFNNTEGVDNNIFGTLNCAQVAIDTGVETFVLISTDKAVRPTNTMGATKRSAELVLQALAAKQSATKFTMVRFGNVLGSSGSVIPLFKQQIKAGGPVTVTDVNMIRYFMTIPESVELVIQAGAMGLGGDVFVLDMGKPVKIDDLAKKMIRLSGLEVKDDAHPEGDIEITYTGLRPGEKLYEELLIGDNVSHTDNSLIMRAQEELLTWDELEPILNNLQTAIQDCDQSRLRELLIELVPGFKPQCEISDILYSE